MGASRTLLRKLNLDLIARIEANGRSEKRKKIPRTKKARPLAAPRYIALNRSDRWPLAKSYQRAREIGPSAAPVR